MTEEEERHGRELAQLAISWHLGVSYNTAKRYMPETKKVAEFWVELAKGLNKWMAESLAESLAEMNQIKH